MTTHSLKYLRRDCDRTSPWYPQNPKLLQRMIEGFRRAPAASPAVGVIAPHAGYAYSGECANLAYSAVQIPQTVLLLALDHHGGGNLVLWPGGPWQSPFGDVPGADELIEALAQTPDASILVAPGHHPVEHSGDNQIPFLKFYRPDVRVAVLNVGISPFDPRDFDFFTAIGDALGDTVSDYVHATNDPVLVVATSDLSHEQGPGNLERVRRQDQWVRTALEHFDERAVLNAVVEQGATMCGSVPVTLQFRIARKLGATRCEIIDQRTSADALKTPADYVVGYLSAVLR